MLDGGLWVANQIPEKSVTVNSYFLAERLQAACERQPRPSRFRDAYQTGLDATSIANEAGTSVSG